MALDFDAALAAIKDAVAEINLSRDPDKQISDDPDAVLYGDGSDLDSMGLVTVVMAAEQHIGDAIGDDIVLASEAAMSRKRSPYRSLGRLAEYAVEVHSASQAAQ
jgi:acyl carrier protein